MGITDLEEQFVFYASYHHDKINKVIHIFCVWPILWSALVLCQYIPLVAPEGLDSLTSSIHPANASFLLAIIYASAYVIMDKKAGTLAAVLVFVSLITSQRFYINAFSSYGYPAWTIAAVIQVVCWIAQFIGHGVFEGRAPALLDNLSQAFIMAPLFVLLEVLFFFGYRKNFQKRMWKRVEEEIAKHKAQSTKPSTKGGKGKGKGKGN